MKKFKQILFSLCLVCCLAILVACDKTESSITGIYVDPESITLEIEQYGNWSTDEIIVKAKYNDDTEKIVTDVTFSNIDTQEVGEQTLIVTHGEFTYEITITITPFDGARDYYIDEIKTPISISTYLDHSNKENTYDDQLTDNEQNSQKGFALTASSIDYVYKVGDDNDFKFSPAISVTYFDEDKDPEDIHSYPIHADVYLWNETAEEFDLISSADLDDYVSINANAHTFDFTQEAVGKMFKIAVRPDFDLIIGEDRYTSDSNLVIDSANNTFNTIDFTFEVVDGYNVYTARDLSVVDNSNDDGKWTEIKTANTEQGLQDLTQINTKGVVLHNDIIITKNDIPSCHFYSDTNTDGLEGEDLAKVNGYMIQEDHYTKLGTVYKRVIADGETFTIEGNYFNIDISNKNTADETGTSVNATFPHVKKVTSSSDSAIVISTTLFCFIDAHTEDRERPELTQKQKQDIRIGFADTNEETCNINNISLIGNSNKNEEIVGQAGLVCYKTENVNFTMNNCLSQAWYIPHFFEGSTRTGDNTVQTLRNCNAFDAYNSLIFAQGARDLRLENCIMIGAGGPAIICDEEADYFELDNNDKTNLTDQEYTYSYSFDGRNTSPVTIDETMKFITNITTQDCILQSWIVGTEQWFNAFNAGSLVGTIKGIDNTIRNPIANGGIGMTILDSSLQKLNVVAVYKSAASISLTSVININGTFKDNDHDFGLDFSNNNVSGQHVMQTFTGALIPIEGQQQAIGYTPTGSTQQEIIDDLKNEIITRINNANQFLAFYLANGMGVVLGAEKIS